MMTKTGNVVRLALAGLLAATLTAALAPPAEAGPSLKGDNFFNPKAGSQRARSTPNAHRGNRADYGHARSGHRASRGHGQKAHKSHGHRRGHSFKRGSGHRKHGGYQRGHGFKKSHGHKGHSIYKKHQVFKKPSGHDGHKSHYDYGYKKHYDRGSKHDSGLRIGLRFGYGSKSGVHIGYGSHYGRRGGYSGYGGGYGYGGQYGSGGSVHYGYTSPSYGHVSPRYGVGVRGHFIIDDSHSTSSTYKRWRYYNDIEKGRIPYPSGYRYYTPYHHDSHVQTYTRHGRVAPPGYKLVLPDNVVVVDRGQRSGAAVAHHTIERGFDLLERGRAGEALTQFAAIADDERQAALPKVGYALAAAMLGDHDKAAWAMRRAIVVDPEAVMYTPVSEQLRERLEGISFHYQVQTEQGRARINDWFLFASVRYILGDPEAAAYAAENAVLAGDSSVSATTLLRAAREQAPPTPRLAPPAPDRGQTDMYGAPVPSPSGDDDADDAGDDDAEKDPRA